MLPPKLQRNLARGRSSAEAAAEGEEAAGESIIGFRIRTRSASSEDQKGKIESMDSKQRKRTDNTINEERALQRLGNFLIY